MKALIWAVALAMPGVVCADEVAIGTATGEMRVAEMPKPVVVFDLAAIDTLDALGVRIDGAPDITPPAYLADAMRDVPTVGTLFEPDFEALASLAPQLIVVGGRSQTQVEALSAIAPTLDMTIPAEDLVAQARRRIDAYGAIFQREDQAARLNADLDLRIRQASTAVKDKGRALIVMTNGGKISVFGAESRFGWLHRQLDLPQALPDLAATNHGEAVSFEFIADTNPDWMLVIDRGAAIGQDGEAAAATLDNPLVASTTAGQAGQIIYLDSARMYLAGGGYQSIIGILDQVTEAFSAAGS